jgi:hypothetical protein
MPNRFIYQRVNAFRFVISASINTGWGEGSYPSPGVSAKLAVDEGVTHTEVVAHGVVSKS